MKVVDGLIGLIQVSEGRKGQSFSVGTVAFSGFIPVVFLVGKRWP